MTQKLDPASVKGFLSASEGQMLAKFAGVGQSMGALVEIGAWCGRSALYIASNFAETRQLLFSVDHHRGSEENQPDWEWFDPEVWDEKAGAIDTLPHFRRNIRHAGLESNVVAMVGDAASIGLNWHTPLGFLFLDGNHTMTTALADYRAWAGHVAKGGFLAIHDVFPDPADGGRPPFEVCQRAEKSGLFTRVDEVDSLVVLERL
ncbi:MAG: hypothetical protein COA47_09630 [Robiginitomaculum sp.]|nr:MAG: hypothetical protein COA47_09630 [Robiginitomaculum sp.]